jgi:small subunit ribosomal protein S17
MKEARGMVISAKMKKAVVVRIERLVQDPVYKKYVTKRTKIKARDEIGCREGDVVAIVPTRPLSKDIRWRVVRVLGRKALPEAEIDTAAGKQPRPAEPAPAVPAAGDAPVAGAREAGKAS